MKVVLYVVKFEKDYEAFFSVAWEVDEVYWKNTACRMFRLSEQVPLGIAVSVCQYLKEQWTKGRSDIGGEKRTEPHSTSDGVEDLRKAVHLVCGKLGAPIPLRVEHVALGINEHSRGMEKMWSREGVRHIRGNSRHLEEVARLASVHLAGRSLLREEAVQLLSDVIPADDSASPLAALQLAALSGALQLTAAVAPKPVAPPQRGFRYWAERLRLARLRGPATSPRRSQELACRRCGSGQDKLRRTPCAACGQACAYCEACLTMGRSRECELLIIGVPLNTTSQPTQSATPTPEELTKRWGLSPAQSDAAVTALSFLNESRGNIRQESSSFLLWAVTGAGKTEMIFPLLEAVLSRGGRALVATPRRDVVLELAPRLAKAFPHYERTVLYGGSLDRWENGALTLATTHQLIRFQEAFDLVLIDELDAFPYHNDPVLHYAADKCRKKTGSTVLLSATPPQHMQRAASRRRLPCARVPVRYHRHPLPVPQRLVIPTVSELLRKSTIPAKLLKALQHSVQRGAQIFLFVPYVRQVEPFVKLLQRCAKSLSIQPETIAGTSSKDSNRTDKVSSFRDHSISLLVTTTILERGVTIPKSDVFILDAHNALFDSASLVQMAGRAGRSANDPFGFVFFGAPVWTKSQRGSVRQIRSMNSLASKHGYLKKKD
ncbi:DEAD/DEAH box helicase [Cohnella sp. WQ 127256]|uniref:DEAD/DEAH box helicase n=1 Tax=Cohnella sp. WQ 127256 TaxID=2938790 RepID=UPI002118961E|nr:helicase-related protein [Cohnella sp. WQ 127256]